MLVSQSSRVEEDPSLCCYTSSCRIRCSDTGAEHLKVSFYAPAPNKSHSDPEKFFPTVFGVTPLFGNESFDYEASICQPNLSESKIVMGKLTRGVGVYLRSSWLLPNMLEAPFYGDLAAKPDDVLDTWGGRANLLSSAGWPPQLDAPGKKGWVASGWTEQSLADLGVEYLQWVHDMSAQCDDNSAVTDVYKAWHKREDIASALRKLLSE